jgi:hypothetical protein
LLKCLDILEETKPDYIINEHQGKAFRYTEAQIEGMRDLLRKRKVLIEALTPWSDANFALDEHWARLYPYDLEAKPGDRVSVQLNLTNHGNKPAKAIARAILPEGYVSAASGAEIPAQSEGMILLSIEVPATANTGLEIVPVQLSWDARYLGQFRHFRLHIR